MTQSSGGGRELLESMVVNTICACTFLYPCYNLAKGRNSPGDTTAELRLRATALEGGLGEHGIRVERFRMKFNYHWPHCPVCTVKHLSRSNLLIALQGF